jgi:hypothetical protein
MDQMPNNADGIPFAISEQHTWADEEISGAPDCAGLMPSVGRARSLDTWRSWRPSSADGDQKGAKGYVVPANIATRHYDDSRVSP